MRFLADERCDFTVVKALRNAGHDITAIAEINPGVDDEVVLALDRSEARECADVPDAPALQMLDRDRRLLDARSRSRLRRVFEPARVGSQRAPHRQPEEPTRGETRGVTHVTNDDARSVTLRLDPGGHGASHRAVDDL